MFFYKSLYEALDWPSTVSFPYCYIWNSCVPTKVGFFAWKLLGEKY